jgi:hypothetical protein
MTDPTVTTTTSTNPGTTASFSYQTTANSLSNTGVVKFVPLSGGPISSPTNIGLGWFEFDPLPNNAQVNFDHTPFSITFSPTQVAGVNAPSGSQGITLTGFLNGSIFGPKNGLPESSQAVATFDPVSNANAQVGNFLTNLTILTPQVPIVPTSAGYHATVEAYVVVTAAPIPEPATFAVFAALAGGLVLRRRLRAAR